jgi:hypothetical protein
MKNLEKLLGTLIGERFRFETKEVLRGERFGSKKYDDSGVIRFGVGPFELEHVGSDYFEYRYYPNFKGRSGNVLVEKQFATRIVPYSRINEILLPDELNPRLKAKVKRKRRVG